ncbi:hypothetical protein [Sedimenticola sp.]|uniref:hypothetical protein n=1 Tax=Sedimenticola sp. TaxID=1940285 RepID=UPI003D114AAB
MSVIQDLYHIFDKEYARHLASRATKNGLVLELRRNLAYLREGLAEQLPTAVILAGLEEAQFNNASQAGAHFNAIQKKSLARHTYGGVREFDKYRGWSTEQLINKAYERIATLKKLTQSADGLDLSARLQYLFKFLMVLMAHIDGVKLKLKSGNRT